jgi:hypothetical protein
MKLLVYIPCWLNYPETLLQIDRLSEQYSHIRDENPDFELEFAVSVNAVSRLKPHIQKKFLEIDPKFTHFQANIADVNINLGFIEALRRSADFFWIISPDDVVSEQAIATIVRHLISSPESNFLVADEENSSIKPVHLRNINFEFRMLSEASFGMVTGVVYQVSAFQNSMHYGVQASLTGWGQLAVILGGARSKRGINGVIIPSSFLYYRGDPKNLTSQQIKENIQKYAHSFFGFVVLISLLSSEPKREIRKWVYANFLKIGSYSSLHTNKIYGYAYITDMKQMAATVIRQCSLITRFIYLLSSNLPLYRLRFKK